MHEMNGCSHSPTVEPISQQLRMASPLKRDLAVIASSSTGGGLTTSVIALSDDED